MPGALTDPHDAVQRPSRHRLSASWQSSCGLFPRICQPLRLANTGFPGTCHRPPAGEWDRSSDAPASGHRRPVLTVEMALRNNRRRCLGATGRLRLRITVRSCTGRPDSGRFGAVSASPGTTQNALMMATSAPDGGAAHGGGRGPGARQCHDSARLQRHRCWMCHTGEAGT